MISDELQDESAIVMVLRIDFGALDNIEEYVRPFVGNLEASWHMGEVRIGTRIHQTSGANVLVGACDAQQVSSLGLTFFEEFSPHLSLLAESGFLMVLDIGVFNESILNQSVLSLSPKVLGHCGKTNTTLEFSVYV